MELELRVQVRGCAGRDDRVRDVLRRLEHAEWVRRVLRQVVPQLQRAAPVHVDALAALLRQSRRYQELGCAICMDDGGDRKGERALQLPCGHRFHASCAQDWLERSNTCPLCRFQLPGAFAGTYAVVAVHSTLLLRRETPCDALLDVCVGGDTLQVAVGIMLHRVRIDADGDAGTGSDTDTDDATQTPRRALCRVSADVQLVDGGDCGCAAASSGQTRSSKRLRDKQTDSADSAKHRRVAA